MFNNAIKIILANYISHQSIICSNRDPLWINEKKIKYLINFKKKVCKLHCNYQLLTCEGQKHDEYKLEPRPKQSPWAWYDKYTNVTNMQSFDLQSTGICFWMMFKKGQFPSEWKKANVVPVHKKNDKLSVNNYRSIAVLPICGKIFERLLYNSMFEFFMENNLISKNQSGDQVTLAKPIAVNYSWHL